MMKWSLSNNKNHPWSIYPEARANNKRVHDRIVRKYKRPDNIVNFGMSPASYGTCIVDEESDSDSEDSLPALISFLICSLKCFAGN